MTNLTKCMEKIMSIGDDQIIPYFELVTNASMDKVESEKKALKEGENPMTVKRRLAFQVVKEFHGDSSAQLAQEYFDKTFSKKIPGYENTQKISAGTNLAGTASAASGASITESKRIISQGAVDVNEETITDPTYRPKEGDKIKVGKKEFFTVKLTK